MAETEGAGRLQTGTEGARWLQAVEHAQDGWTRLQDPDY